LKEQGIPNIKNMMKRDNVGSMNLKRMARCVCASAGVEKRNNMYWLKT
jgi:hypothetical protein